MIAIYPGSFDPITLGHIDIIERGAKLFEKVIVAVLSNPSKNPLFAVEKRLEQIAECTNQMAHTNKTLNSEIETVFLATTKEYSFLSSSIVKEIAQFGGSIDHLVSPNIARDMYHKYQNQ